VGMTTELPRHQTLPLVRAGASLRWRTPVWTRTAVTAIRGRSRVEEVELTDLDSGVMRAVSCDTVVFTGDWIPDHELAVMGGLMMDPGTRGPRVDAALRTSRPGVFAAGNLLHGAETADVAALSGRHAAVGAAAFLRGSAWPDASVPIECEPPLCWISPGAVSAAGARAAGPAGRPPRDRFLLRAHEFVARPRVEIGQDGRTLWSGRTRSLVPGRSARLPDGWAASVDAAAGPVRVRLA
jgi:Pyridine nucleotide-disulphide oxidoreductase